MEVKADSLLLKEEKKEFWGTNLPSLLASLGGLAGLLGFLSSFKPPIPFILYPLSIVLITAALIMNLKRNRSVKWRKLNIFIYLSLLLIVISYLLITVFYCLPLANSTF